MNRQQRVAHVVALLGIGAGVLAGPTLAQDCPELVGQWPYGPAHAVAVSGNYAYFGSGAALLVADVSIPAALHAVGGVTLPGVVHGVAVSGSYAYVAGTGLHVVDVSTPSAPVEVGSVDTPGWAEGVAVAGGYAYVAADYAGLRVIDVSTPSAPVEVGFVDTPGYALDVAVAGLYAYVVDYHSLRVIDVSTPSAPVEVGFVDTLGDALDVAVAGLYAYVAESYALRVIDVSTPSAPVEVGSVDTPDWAEGVAVAGGYAYVADGGGLRVIDVSTPSAPLVIGFVDTPVYALDVAVAGLYAYVADGGGLRVIDVSTASTPVVIGFVDTPGYALDVAVAGLYAYVADSYALRVIDVSTPSAPIEVGSADTPEEFLAVAVAGGYAYVVDYHSLRVIDVSTPSAPVEVGSADTPDDALDVAVAGGHAYVADGWGLRVIDVSTPSAPVEVGFADIQGAFAVAVAGGYAYVVDYYSLRVIDVSTPSAPIEVGFVDTPGSAYGVAVAGGYAYVADYYSLRVIDVSTPSAPIEVGFVDTPGWAYGVAVSGGYAYVAARTGGLRVIDVSTPSAPVEVGSADTPGDALGVAVSGGYVFVADFGAGLTVFRDCAPGPTPDPRECIIPAAAVAAGAEGAFFQTDLEINNRSASEAATVTFGWLPRGADNAEYLTAGPIALTPGQSRRYANVLTELFGLGPDSLGALKLVASTESVIGMSRTYQLPTDTTPGTFGQGLPAIRSTEMIAGTERRRIVFLSEDDDFRANVGCVNGTAEPVAINIAVYDHDGAQLDLRSLELGPYANNQINRILRPWEPVQGAVEVWSDSDEALYYCYGSVVDNLTSDPTTILPQAPSGDLIFIPAAALSSGYGASFFQTDVDLQNAGPGDLTYSFLWLPRATNNSLPARSAGFSLTAGTGVRYANVLGGVFRFEPDQVGALAVEASGPGLVAMSRTYNLPAAKVAGTFGQGMPGIPAEQMIPAGVKQRILFMDENDAARANVGCQNGSLETAQVLIELFDPDGRSLEVRTIYLLPLSNQQVNRVFRDHAPISAGYVDVRTTTPGATVYCYGSVVDNLTSDPTTVLPQ